MHWTEVQIKAENDEQQECGSDEDDFLSEFDWFQFEKSLFSACFGREGDDHIDHKNMLMMV